MTDEELDAIRGLVAKLEPCRGTLECNERDFDALYHACASLLAEREELLGLLSAGVTFVEQARDMEMRLMAARTARRQAESDRDDAVRLVRGAREAADQFNAVAQDAMRKADDHRRQRDEAHREVDQLTAQVNDLLQGATERSRAAFVERRELEALRDVEAGHVEEIAGLRERVRELESELRDMTDRYHEASNEADLLRDRIEHAGAYGRIQETAREHSRAKREEAPQACFERPGGCSCWKAGGK